MSNNIILRNSNQRSRRRAIVVPRPLTAPSTNMPNVPPNFNAAIVVRHTFRYVAKATGVSTITPLNVMNVLSFYTGPTLAENYSIFSAYRVRKVRMWGFTEGSNALSKNSIEFLVTTAGTVGAKPRVYSAVSTGTALPGKILAIPPKSSSASDWQNTLTSTTTTTGFSMIINYTTNSVIDLHLECVINNGDPITSSPFIGASPANRIVANNLDSTSTPTNLIAVGKYPN